MGVIISLVENTSNFVMSQNLFLISKHDLDFLISQNLICDIKKSGLFFDIINFLISQNHKDFVISQIR